MSTGGWRLQTEAELRTVYPWLEREPDPRVRGRVLDWLVLLASDPVGRGREERPGVFSAEVYGTDVTVVWTLNHERRWIVLALIG